MFTFVFTAVPKQCFDSSEYSEEFVESFLRGTNIIFNIIIVNKHQHSHTLNPVKPSADPGAQHNLFEHLIRTRKHTTCPCGIYVLRMTDLKQALFCFALFSFRCR